MKRWLYPTAAGLAVAVLLAVAACRQDGTSPQRTLPAGAAPPDTVQQIPLVPGMPQATRQLVSPYEGDARARHEGERLYNWMNCSGCHFGGGGGIGPALMDDDWIYGGEPAQIFDSIASGRANGMPAYGRRLASDQIWRIVEHVRSLSRNPPATPQESEKWSATRGK